MPRLDSIPGSIIMITEVTAGSPLGPKGTARKVAKGCTIEEGAGLDMPFTGQTDRQTE